MVDMKNDVVSIYFDSFTKALTLVVALAWNNAFTEYFKSHPNLQALGPWLYAFVITLVVVSAMIGLAKLRAKADSWYKQLKKKVKKELDEEDEEAAEQFNSGIDYTQF
jgi:hypothetical protein